MALSLLCAQLQSLLRKLRSLKLCRVAEKNHLNCIFLLHGKPEVLFFEPLSENKRYLVVCVSRNSSCHQCERSHGGGAVMRKYDDTGKGEANLF